MLEAANIRAFRHGIISDFGPVKILPLTFKRSYFFDHAVIRTPLQLKTFCMAGGKSPLIVLAHWGKDYVADASPFENELLNTMADCGISAVIGSHTHRASTKVEIRAGGALQSIFSMGNLIFDQTGPSISGSLVELRGFRQRTIALRIIPIPNVFSVFKLSTKHW